MDAWERCLSPEMLAVAPVAHARLGFRRVSTEAFTFWLDAGARQCGTVGAAFDEDGREVTVTALDTFEPFRGQGVATYLLLVLAAYAAHEGARTVTVDDMSARAWRPDNVYAKLGLRYLNPEPEPEMAGDLATVLAKWPAFVAKYCAKRGRAERECAKRDCDS